MRTYKIDDVVCNIGQNSRENWTLLENASPKNILFHLRSFPSCFVILETDSLDNILVINKAAELCKTNTKYRNVPHIKVDYTFCENVIKGDIVGEIIFKSNKKVKTIVI